MFKFNDNILFTPNAAIDLSPVEFTPLGRISYQGAKNLRIKKISNPFHIMQGFGGELSWTSVMEDFTINGRKISSSGFPETLVIREGEGLAFVNDGSASFIKSHRRIITQITKNKMSINGEIWGRGSEGPVPHEEPARFRPIFA